MELELFDWRDWDGDAGGKTEYYGVKLKQPLGGFLAGATFEYVILDWSTGELVLYNIDRKTGKSTPVKVQLKLVVA